MPPAERLCARRRLSSLSLLIAACLAGGQARSPSHDTQRPMHAQDAPSGFVHTPLPRPLAGLERIGGRGGSSAGVCRSGHGALPCRAGGRSLSKERGRPLSPFMGARKELEGDNNARASASMGGGGTAATKDWSGRSRRLSPSRVQSPSQRQRDMPGPSPMASGGRGGPRAVRSVKTAMSATHQYEILGESILWESPYGAMTVYERTVRFPDDEPGLPDGGGGDDVPALDSKRDADVEGKTVKWHIVGCPLGNFSSVVIFPFDSRTGTCSLISEYCPGVHDVKSGIPGGLYEERKHADLLEAARDELNEEAGLEGGTWFALAPEGVPQDKYSRNRLHPYLVIDPTIDPHPKSQDDTERIHVEHGVSLDEAKRRILAGDMAAPSAMATLMAIDKLRELGYVR